MHITKSKWKLLGRVWLFATPWKLACQAPLSMEFPRLEYWSGLPFPPPGDLTDPGVEHGFPALQAGSLLSEPPGKPITKWVPWFLIVEDKWLPWRKAFFPNENFLHAKSIHLLSTVLLWKVVPYSWVVKYSWFWWTTAPSPGDFAVVVVQSLSHVQPFVTPGTATHQASLFLTISQSLPKFMFIELVMPSNHLIFCYPLPLLLREKCQNI